MSHHYKFDHFLSDQPITKETVTVFFVVLSESLQGAHPGGGGA